jgi:hypothetical protein
MTIGWYRRPGLTLYYRAERGPCGISVDARRGPQLVADGMPLAGRIPSEVEQWTIERAQAREPFTEVAYIVRTDPISMAPLLVKHFFQTFGQDSK